MNPKYPVYIVSKGRWDSRLTSKALEYMKVPYYIVIEGQEYDNYASVIDPKKIIVLDKSYQDEYDTCDDLGNTRSKGPGAARNFVWQHSIDLGAKWHWVIDDNMWAFHRLNRNSKITVNSGTIFRCMEDFVDRYENIAQAGPNYFMFCKHMDFLPPYILNTRIYSCLLIRNDLPYRWRGRYNEDTDLSLRVLKDGWCTVQFNAFLCGKMPTQTIKGGNTAEFYHAEGEAKKGQAYADGGTTAKSQMIEDLHPDVAKVVWKFNRWHHHVDYSGFKQKLIRKKDIVIPQGINNYGMILVNEEDDW